MGKDAGGGGGGSWAFGGGGGGGKGGGGGSPGGSPIGMGGTPGGSISSLQAGNPMLNAIKQQQMGRIAPGTQMGGNGASGMNMGGQKPIMPTQAPMPMGKPGMPMGGPGAPGMGGGMPAPGGMMPSPKPVGLTPPNPQVAAAIQPKMAQPATTPPNASPQMQQLQIPKGTNPNSIPGGPATSWRPQNLQQITDQTNSLLKTDSVQHLMQNNTQFQKLYKNLPEDMQSNLMKAATLTVSPQDIATYKKSDPNYNYPNQQEPIHPNAQPGNNATGNLSGATERPQGMPDSEMEHSQIPTPPPVAGINQVNDEAVKGNAAIAALNSNPALAANPQGSSSSISQIPSMNQQGSSPTGMPPTSQPQVPIRPPQMQTPGAIMPSGAPGRMAARQNPMPSGAQNMQPFSPAPLTQLQSGGPSQMAQIPQRGMMPGPSSPGMGAQMMQRGAAPPPPPQMMPGMQSPGAGMGSQMRPPQQSMMMPQGGQMQPAPLSMLQSGGPSQMAQIPQRGMMPGAQMPMGGMGSQMRMPPQQPMASQNMQPFKVDPLSQMKSGGPSSIPGVGSIGMPGQMNPGAMGQMGMRQGMPMQGNRSIVPVPPQMQSPGAQMAGMNGRFTPQSGMPGQQNPMPPGANPYAQKSWAFGGGLNGIGHVNDPRAMALNPGQDRVNGAIPPYFGNNMSGNIGLKNMPSSIPSTSISTTPGGKSIQDVLQSKSPYELAQSFLGETGSANTKQLQQFFQKSIGQNIDPTKTAWCAAFANSVLKSSGYSGTGSLAARSFLNYGTSTSKPTQGDLVVFKGANDDGVHGHVGFYAGMSNDGKYVKVLGGNQGKAGGVSIENKPASLVLGYRHPPTPGEIQQKGLPGSQGSKSMGGLSNNGVNLIAQQEGFRPQAYNDNKQFSIGYGTKATSPNQTITQGDAMSALKNSANQASSFISQHVKTPLTQNQMDALTSFTYNVGTGTFKNSSVYQALQKGDMKGAATAMLKYNKAGGKVSQGLTNRRQKEYAMFMGQ